MTAKPLTCFSCSHSNIRGDLFAGDGTIQVVCLCGHADTPKRQDQCAQFSYEPGTDEAERDA